MGIGYESVISMVVITVIPIILFLELIRIIILKIRNKVINPVLEILGVIIVSYTIAILFFTFKNEGNRDSTLNLIPFVDIYNAFTGYDVINQEYAIREIIYNFIMMFPLGVLLVFYQHIKSKLKNIKIILYGACFIIFIETVQYFFIKGRTANIDDFILNFSGFLLGIFIANIIKNFFNFNRVNFIINQNSED